jgi:hypothetical protein
MLEIHDIIPLVKEKFPHVFKSLDVIQDILKNNEIPIQKGTMTFKGKDKSYYWEIKPVMGNLELLDWRTLNISDKNLNMNIKKYANDLLENIDRVSSFSVNIGKKWCYRGDDIAKNINEKLIAVNSECQCHFYISDEYQWFSVTFN